MIIINLIQNIILLIGLVAAYQVVISRNKRHTSSTRFIFGILFGGVAVAGMMTPVNYMPGIIFDGRTIVLSVAGLIGGPLVASISAIIAGAYRFVLGGMGLIVGETSIIGSAAIGVLFYYLWHNKIASIRAWYFWAFGLLVHTALLATFLLLPHGFGHKFVQEAGLAIVGFYPVATMLICLLFRDYEEKAKERFQLQRKTEFLSQSQQAAHIGSWTIDLRSRQIDWSEETYKIYGVSPEKFKPTTKSIFKLIHAQDRPKITATLNAWSEGKFSAPLEFRVILPNGESRIILGQGGLKLDAKNKPIGVVGTAQDVTERKREEKIYIDQLKAIERKLKDERNLLHSLINNIPDYIFYKNIAGEYLMCNKIVADYFGHPVEKIIGRTDFDLVDPETALLFRGQDAAVLALDRTCNNEESITLPDGKSRVLETIKTPFKDSDGNLLGLIGIGRDITQRKAHEVKISHLSNFYACLSKINHAIVQINNEQALFATVCTITATLQQVNLVWIGRPDGTTQLMAPVAMAGGCLDYLAGLVVSVDPAKPEGQGPTGLAYRESRIVTVNDFQTNASTVPWHASDKQHFVWGSSCAVPIMCQQKPYAVLTVYSTEKGFFDEDVIRLMAELGSDLSFALDLYAHETARRIAEGQLELSAKVFSQSQEAIIITDKNNGIISVNRAFTTITGYEEQEVLGKNPKIFASGRQKKDFYREPLEILQKNNFWQGELWGRHKNGAVYPVWLTISAVRDESGNIINYIATFSDITQHKEAEQQIEHLAHYDVLTNLPNRLLLKSRIDYELLVAGRNKKTFALLFIDLDYFKNINDSLGHSVGDQILVKVGQRLLACIREEDTVARLGGDEFNILLTNCCWNGAAIVAKKIIATLSEAISYQNYQLYITPSIGISLYPDNGDSYETLSKNADTALYKAKDMGRNQYQFFTSAMQEQTQRRMAIENDLRQAIAHQELTVYFHPQVNAQTGKITGAEALLRWRHPLWGMVPPAEFIPVAEECGLILSIGDWVLEQAIAQARQWHDLGFPLTVAVNLSLAQFRANTLLEKVRQVLKNSHLPPQYLELELTESIAMQNAELAIEITRQLTGLGIKLSIDDFGTGYSSLSYLQRFSLHKLKIDQSFTKNMVSNKDSENIVDAIISLAKSLNLKTIAEGVETKQQLEMFKQKRCDEIQGYYFSQPVPADTFLALAKKGFM